MPKDFVIAGAQVLDGTGAAATPADVYIAEGTIHEVRPASDNHGAWEVLDASGLTLAPGFIDAHSHADNAPFLPEHDTSKILQGVTTEVVGNCGFSLAPRAPEHAGLLAAFSQRLFPPVDWPGQTFAEFLHAADLQGCVTNYVPLVGHGTLRIAAMGMEARKPTRAEQDKMGSLLDESLAAGAFGLSSGLIYPPGLFSDTEELIRLAERLPRQRLYTTHIRGEGDHLEESVAEALRIGEEAGCRVQISHHKAAGTANWGKTKATLRMIAEARARGVEVDQDVYPYTASSTMLTATLPPSFLAGSEEDVLGRLQDSASVGELKRAIAEGVDGWENHVANSGWDGILISTTADHRFEGMTLAEVAQMLQVDPVDGLVHVLLRERLRASMILFIMSEDDLQRVLSDEHTMIGSDGLPPGLGGKPHPRLFGTFPRVLSRYVREIPVLSLAEAVRKMTSLAAEKFRIPARGLVTPGKVADIVAFEADTIRDVGDYRDPVHPPKGIRWVMQAGQMVVENGQFLGRRAGTRLTPHDTIRF
jgi:dihydroorotase/N-acyl-D-amino-acid deacylase